MKKTVIALFLGSLILLLYPAFSTAEENTKAIPRVANYWNAVKGKIVQCVLCPRKCILDEGQRGFCTVRLNKDGVLYTLGYGNPVAVHIDPIEKKPFFHVLPGTNAFSLAVAGCNMRCLFCQNWQISQSKPDEVPAYDMPPEKVVDEAIKSGAPFIVYTYTEPTVFYEYMLDIAKLAKTKGLKNGMHTCGYINPEPLRELLRYMDAVNVDLKSFNPEFYKKMGAMAELGSVLDALKIIKKEGVWLEITNLIIPGQNDDPNEIRLMCEWIKANLGDSVPLHFSRFMPSFRLQNLPPTPIEKLEEAYAIAKSVGLKYVYIGNLPGSDREDTYCAKCGELTIKRVGYQVSGDGLFNGTCKKCGNKIEGIWRN